MKEHPILFSAPMVRAILDGRKTQTRRICHAFGENLHKGKKLNEWDLSSGPFQLTEEDFPVWHWRGRKPPKVGDWAQEIQTDVDDNVTFPIRNPYGYPGDRLWVKEKWTGTWGAFRHDMHLVYAADGSERITRAIVDYILPKVAAKVGNWVTPLFMPRWASRITLEIIDVRVQRLQEISNEDARAEGVDACPHRGASCGFFETGFNQCFGCAFRLLWNQINGPRGYGWDANPYVWAVSFKRVQP
jgi:hypothetical protein